MSSEEVKVLPKTPKLKVLKPVIRRKLAKPIELNDIVEEAPIEVKPEVKVKPELKEGDIIEEDGVKYKIKIVKGKRRHADGKEIEYTYPRKYPIKDKETRGRKAAPHKFALRRLIKDLPEDKCLELLNYLNSKVSEEDIDEEKTV